VRDEDLFSFVGKTVRSVWGVELLLMMRRQAGRVWRVEELVRELRASTTVVADSLAAFETAGLVRRDGDTFTYAPATPVLAEVCDRLDALYRERPVKVINAIAAPRSRLQGFADAFRLKDDGE
jgi:DNA-binding HxlR family transcriptional regulator